MIQSTMFLEITLKFYQMLYRSLIFMLLGRYIDRTIYPDALGNLLDFLAIIITFAMRHYLQFNSTNSYMYLTYNSLYKEFSKYCNLP